MVGVAVGDPLLLSNDEREDDDAQDTLDDAVLRQGSRERPRQVELARNGKGEEATGPVST